MKEKQHEIKQRRDEGRHKKESIPGTFLSQTKINKKHNGLISTESCFV